MLVHPADIASLATAAGVALVVVQLIVGRRQARTAFEDDLAREYREIATALPAEAFFDTPDVARPLGAPQDDLEQYVRYFDLSNHQVFLRMQRRVGGKTWRQWSDGIRDNLERPGFAEAWTYVRRHSGNSYTELASYYRHWQHDPAWWTPPWWPGPVKRVKGHPSRPRPWRPASPS